MLFGVLVEVLLAGSAVTGAGVRWHVLVFCFF